MEAVGTRRLQRMRTSSLTACAATLLAILLTAGVAGGQPRAPSRGELLYQTHCVACHDKQVHWRARKIVADWAGLAAEVRRWEANLDLGWNDEAVAEVTRYLNRLFYRFPEPAERQLG